MYVGYYDTVFLVGEYLKSCPLHWHFGLWFHLLGRSKYKPRSMVEECGRTIT